MSTRRYPSEIEMAIIPLLTQYIFVNIPPAPIPMTIFFESFRNLLRDIPEFSFLIVFSSLSPMDGNLLHL
jgi:hypothetical protein